MISPGKTKFMYAGNLTVYQGIDILVKAFRDVDGCLVVVGGDPRSVDKYKQLAFEHDVRDIHFLGSQPKEDIASYLDSADVLVSPRLEGSNIPSKLFSYIAARKATILTEIPAHTQLDTDCFVYCKPESSDLRQKMSALLNDTMREDYRTRIVDVSAKYGREGYLREIDVAYELQNGL